MANLDWACLSSINEMVMNNVATAQTNGCILFFSSIFCSIRFRWKFKQPHALRSDWWVHVRLFDLWNQITIPIIHGKNVICLQVVHEKSQRELPLNAKFNSNHHSNPIKSFFGRIIVVKCRRILVFYIFPIENKIKRNKYERWTSIRFIIFHHWNKTWSSWIGYRTTPFILSICIIADHKYVVVRVPSF